ncbi:MAG: hypothetical protein AAFZ09_09270, partial [Pseudomonadota bacterium]
VAALSIDVLNVAPTTAATGPDFGEVGVLYSVGIDPVVDPGDDALALTINWGDSTSSTFGAGSIPTSATHLYAQPGDYTITFDGTDEDGTYLTLATKTITVLPQAVTLTDDVDRFITTGTLRDRVFGLDGSDAILTAGGNDILVGGAGGDRLQAGDGDDILVGGLGPDVLNLGAGTDTVVVSTADFDGTFTADFIEDYVPGEDRIQIIGFGFTQFSELTFNPVAGNLALMLNATSVLVFEGYTAVGQLNQGDFSFPAAGPALGSLGSVGNPILSDNDDRFITSDPGANIADAGAGEDVLITGPGNDVLIGGADGDRLQGGAGDDELRGGPGPDILQGDGGADLFVLVPGDFPAGLEVDFIEDFEPGTDRVSLLGFGFTDFSQLTWQSTADGIAANLGNSNFLVFSGFADETGFSAADFILDPPAPSSAAPAPMAISGFASIAAPSAAASRAASAPVEDEAPALLLEAPVEAEGPAPLQDAPVAEEVPVVAVRVVEENPAPVAAVASMASHRAPGEPIVTEPAQVVFAAQPLVAPEATVLQVGPVEMVSEIALAGPVREDAAAAERTGA